MAFLRPVPLSSPSDFALYGERVFLRYPQVNDFEAWAALRRDSEAFLRPWEPAWTSDELTRTAFRRRLRRYARDIRNGEAHPFFVLRIEDERLVGGCTLSNIRRGAASAGVVGYWAGERFTRRGYTIDAVRALVSFAHGELRLRRVEAACLPENMASQSLLAKAGFLREGRARDYLKINGAWRDHVLFAMVKGG